MHQPHSPPPPSLFFSPLAAFLHPRSLSFTLSVFFLLRCYTGIFTLSLSVTLSAFFFSFCAVTLPSHVRSYPCVFPWNPPPPRLTWTESFSHNITLPLRPPCDSPLCIILVPLDCMNRGTSHFLWRDKWLLDMLLHTKTCGTETSEGRQRSWPSAARHVSLLLCL